MDRLPGVQEQADDAAEQWEEANARYKSVLGQLQEERSRSAGLEARAAEAAAQLSLANSKYQDVLAQLKAERAASAALEVRPGCGACCPQAQGNLRVMVMPPSPVPPSAGRPLVSMGFPSPPVPHTTARLASPCCFQDLGYLRSRCLRACVALQAKANEAAAQLEEANARWQSALQQVEALRLGGSTSGAADAQVKEEAEEDEGAEAAARKALKQEQQEEREAAAAAAMAEAANAMSLYQAALEQLEAERAKSASLEASDPLPGWPLLVRAVDVE